LLGIVDLIALHSQSLPLHRCELKNAKGPGLDTEALPFEEENVLAAAFSCHFRSSYFHSSHQARKANSEAEILECLHGHDSIGDVIREAQALWHAESRDGSAFACVRRTVKRAIDAEIGDCPATRSPTVAAISVGNASLSR
jgi:hypothetical protein